MRSGNERKFWKNRNILQYHFDKGENATQACANICDVYGPGTLSKATAKMWFSRIRSGEFDVEDAPRSGRPIFEKADTFIEKVEQDRHISSHELAKVLNIDHKTVLNHLYKDGFEKKLDVWVTEVTEKNMIERVSICNSLLERNDFDPFLKRLITADYGCSNRRGGW